MTDLHRDLARLGSLATRRRLGSLGHSKGAIATALRDGGMLPLTRSWVATRAAPLDAVLAVIHRGRLTGASALKSYGIWAGPDPAVHVLVPPHSSGTVIAARTPLADFARPPRLEGVAVHWGHERSRTAGIDEWRVSVVDALTTFAGTSGIEHFIAAVDNALHKRQLQPSALPQLEHLLSSKFARALSLVDARAESGSETIARLGFIGLGRVDIQVQVGPHRLDILIDGWLNIEIDSGEFHDGRAREDNARDTWLVVRGYRVKRFSYEEVLDDWASVELAVRELLSRPPAREPRVQATAGRAK